MRYMDVIYKIKRERHWMTIRTKLFLLMVSFVMSMVCVVSFMGYFAYKDSYNVAVNNSKILFKVLQNMFLFFLKPQKITAHSCLVCRKSQQR